MKRAIIWMLLLTAAMNVAMAQKKNPYRSERQEKVWTDRKAWFNFAYGKQSLKIDKGDICLHSDWGAGISTGRTYYLHRRPILGLMKFGLDWSYFECCLLFSSFYGYGGRILLSGRSGKALL